MGPCDLYKSIIYAAFFPIRQMAAAPASRKGILVASEHFSFPKEEDKILAYWRQIDAFQTSHKRSIGRPAYSFYDGPPFATGLPHYGHILAGTIKDVVTRYAYQTGHCVERRFGWGMKY